LDEESDYEECSHGYFYRNCRVREGIVDDSSDLLDLRERQSRGIPRLFVNDHEVIVANFIDMTL